MSIIMDGKALSIEIRAEIKAKIEEMLNAIKAQKEAAADEAEKQNDENDLTTDNITVTY